MLLKTKVVASGHGVRQRSCRLGHRMLDALLAVGSADSVTAAASRASLPHSKAGGEHMESNQCPSGGVKAAASQASPPHSKQEVSIEVLR
jgi:hypothetical protein